MSPRPGVTKVRRVPHVSTTTKSFVRALESAVRAWLERADVVSEGAPDASGGAYFGSTSILLAWATAPDEKLAEPSSRGALLCDPHLRARALRVARREAQARAGAELSVMRADLVMRPSARGLEIVIDVEAQLLHRIVASRR